VRAAHRWSRQMSEGIPLAAPVRYATFTRRFRALVIDNLFLSGTSVALFFLGDAVSDVAGATRVVLLLILALVLLYEPLLVSRRGATIGHAVARLRVVDVRTGRWPSFGRAFVRFLIKGILTMALNRRHQAVHDLLTHTAVQVPETEELVEFHAERIEEADVVLPSRARRLVVILLYLVVVFFASNIAIALVAGPGCLSDRVCSGGARAAIQLLGVRWLAVSGATIIAGWKGLLFGARRSRGVQSDVALA
jgi:uncharacterized RDD family membrane protein YckC